MLYLNEKDIDNIVVEEDLIKAVEEGFKIYEEKTYKMPDRIHLNNGDDTMLYMPCLTEDTIGTKILSLFPGNRAKGLPVIDGLMLLNDIDTGAPKAILDGKAITGYRTGALGATGVKYTSYEDCESLGLIGPGVQGFYQLLFASKVRNINNINVYGPFEKELEDFIKRLKAQLPNIKINSCKNSEEVVKNSEIIITATPSENPVLPDDEDLLKGKHIIAIGSYKPKMRELPESLYKLLDKVYIDTELAIEESGDIVVPLENKWIKKEDIITISQLQKENKKIEKNQTTLFKCVGMALLDLVVAEELYKKALETKSGKII